MKLNIQLFAYTKKEWKDLPSKDTPILAADLNNIENQLQTNTNDINALNTNLNNIENQLQTNTNDINALNTYSTSEQRIGTWIDGKPIYRQVIKVTSIDSANNNYDVAISISNLNEIVNIGGVIKITSTNTYKPITVIYTDNSNAINSHYSFSVYAITNSYISLSYGGWWKTTFDKAYIILEYTKTTD